MARSDVLDPRERKFIQYYTETNNGTRSAILAGYGRNYKVAGVQATRLLARAKIRNAIDQANAKIMQRLDFTPDRILKRFAHFAAHEPEEIKAPDVLKALTELAKIAKLYPATQTEISGPGGGPIATANLHAHKVELAGLEPEQRDQLRQVLLALKAKSDDSEGSSE